MPAGKFSAVIGKVSDHVGLDPAVKLTFEASDGNRPMTLYCASSPRLAEDKIEMTLAGRPGKLQTP